VVLIFYLDALKKKQVLCSGKESNKNFSIFQQNPRHNIDHAIPVSCIIRRFCYSLAWTKLARCLTDRFNYQTSSKFSAYGWPVLICQRFPFLF